MSWWAMRCPVRARFVWVAIAALLGAAVICPRAHADESLGKLRDEFHQEKDPVKRAKLFPKLGTALIAEMRKAESTREYDSVPPLFLEYHDAATAACAGLMATNRDAEKHSKGFRELEMHLRRSLHSLNDIVFGLPLEDREALLGLQRDMEGLDDRLIRALFPHTPETPKTPPSAAEAHPLL